MKLLFTTSLWLAPIGIFLIWSAREDGRLAEALAIEGKSTMGTIQNFTVRRGYHSVYVDYKPRKSAIITQKFYLPEDLVQKHILEDEIVEDEIEVLYLKSDPEKAQLAEHEIDEKGGVIIGIIFTILGLITAPIALIKRFKSH